MGIGRICSHTVDTSTTQNQLGNCKCKNIKGMKTKTPLLHNHTYDYKKQYVM